MTRFHFCNFLICFLLTSPVLAVKKNSAPSRSTKVEKKATSEEIFIKSLLDLSKSPMTKIESTKTVESSLIGKKTNYTGDIFLSHGKFRWDTKTPEKSTLLFDGKTLWVIEDRFVTKTQVTKNMKSQTLQTILMDPKSLKQKFDLTEKKENSNEITFSLKPKTKDIAAKDIVLSIDVVSKDLKQLSYNDNDAKTTIQFHKIEKMKKIDKSYFTYKPKPGDQVTEM